MAQLALSVMCRSERPPPDITSSLACSATKSPTTQNAAYVPRNIRCQFLKTLVIKSLAGIGGGLDQRRDRDAAIFMVVDCTLRIRHFLFSFDFVGCRFVMDYADFWRDSET